MPPPPNPELRRQVIAIYKELLHLGRAYPLGYAYYQTRLHAAFRRQRDVVDEQAIRAGIRRAEFVRREIEALYFLKRYRTLRQRYDNTDTV